MPFAACRNEDAPTRDPRRTRRIIGRSSTLNGEDEGGNPACYLSELTDGRLLSPSDRIHWSNGAASGGEWHVVIGSKASNADASEFIPVLAPQPGEDEQDYLARLNQPQARTAAWRIALRSEVQPVALSFTGPGPHAEILLSYLRGLLE